MAQVSRQQETIEYHEANLEDVYDGILCLDRVLKLIRASSGGETCALSRGQLINVAFYIAGRVAYGIDDLAEVQGRLPNEAQRQLESYQQRFRRQHEKVMRLKLTGLD